MLALSAGIVLALALPGLQWWPLIFLFPGLLLESLTATRDWKTGAALGLLAGCAHWILAAHWVVPLLRAYAGMSLPTALGSLFLMGMVLGTTWALPMGLLVLFPRRLRALAFPVLWILSEGIRSFPPFQFPWNTTASCLSSVPSLLASASVWGAPGLGWALLALGSAAWALRWQESRRKGVVLASTALGMLILLSVIAPNPKPCGRPLKVVALQPGTLLEERWDPSNWQNLADGVWKMSGIAAASRPGLILWPESAMPFRFDSDHAYRNRVLSIAKEMDATLFLNSLASSKSGDLSNSVFAVTPKAGVSRFDKIHLVPFGEYVPLWARFFFPEHLVHEIGDFVPGRKVSLLDTGGVPAGVSICYEVVFPRLSAAEVRQGAEILVTLTNDGWYGRSWALDQHFAQAVLRAVECRRWVLRAALTGISGFISPEGRVLKSLPAGRRGWIEGEIQPMTGLSPAARWPDWWNGVMLIFLVVLWCRRQSGS